MPGVLAGTNTGQPQSHISFRVENRSGTISPYVTADLTDQNFLDVALKFFRRRIDKD